MGVHNTEAYPEIKRLLEIPEDEPIFILRAKDVCAAPTLYTYSGHAAMQGSSAEFVTGAEQCAESFADFAEQNPDRMKVPD